MQRPAPGEWIEKYDRAQRVYASLRRPDGSLAVFGDSGDETYPLGPPVAAFDSERRAQRLVFYGPEWRPTEANSVFPVSGLSVWWEGLESWPNSPDLSQTVVTWSSFAGHGHKHADEMSVLFWGRGADLVEQRRLLALWERGQG